MFGQQFPTPRPPLPARGTVRPFALLAACVLLLATGPIRAADVADALKLYRTGNYVDCLARCAAQTAGNSWDPDWWLLKLRAELTTGRTADALATYESAAARFPDHLALRLAGRDALLANNRPDDAAKAVEGIRAAVARRPGLYLGAADRVAVGRALVLAGADARKVLENFYDAAKKADPKAVEPYLASGELALEKQDYALAAEAFAEAARRTPDDPDVQYGLARAFDNDSERATAALKKALTLNPRHVDSLLFQADNLIDQEDYTQAEEVLQKVVEINPTEPRAWAYRAALAHVAGDDKREAECRHAALQTWATNPDVDHLIGRKISQKYRFAEGSAYQRQALGLAPGHEGAALQLCQDLLRLGQEDEGWALAADVFRRDPYNVVAYNLITLRDTLSKFATLKGDGFVVRMDPREAAIYGPHVLRLLARARDTLGPKYGLTLPGTITVEIFPQQKDFAIRTFGLPGGAGFLGVCFGPVVTINSPASRAANPANWETILWHEFCHVVTLSKTKNKMPRWLSEGISVYEERLAGPAWGQVMTPDYREMILAGGATPVSQLSGAFLHPATPGHLSFAYYESSMVVQYVVDHYGATALSKILTDLGDNVPINAALARSTEPIEKLDESFAKWFRGEAEKLAPKADLAHPDLALDADSTAMNGWNKAHPDNFWGLLGEGRALLAEGKAEPAKVPLRRAAELYPNYGQAGGPYLLLAQAHRELKEAGDERQMLQKHLALNDHAIEARLRLAELAADQNDWPAVRTAAEQVAAINPLTPAPHRYLLQAAEKLHDRPLAIQEHRTLLEMNPLDPADHHYRLAGLLADDKKFPEAKREVVLALEQAPRFLAAHQLLLRVVGEMGPTPAARATAPTTAPAPADPAIAPPPAAPPTTVPSDLAEMMRRRRAAEGERRER